MSLIGKKVGSFKKNAYYNDEFIEVANKDIAGKWSIFFFYPADFTFVCPTELQDLANHKSAFEDAGCEIYSVSCDTEFVHKAWHDSLEIIGTL